ncbi:methyltransferase domain-containing protein [Litorimonas sp. WD9-15]|uniref:methyltransferase domain-containing protein n=1 Tax=Litorimonas sp. WD9-15 TaxID=3418716 RepID=UPI003CFEF9E3
MIAHTIIETSDLDAAVLFYDKLFAIMGGRSIRSREWERAYAVHRGAPAFVLQEIKSGAATPTGQRAIIVLQCNTEADVQKVYDTALRLGGQPDSAPAWQDETIFTASLYDKDGHKIGLRARQKTRLPVPQKLRRGSRQEDDRASVASGIKLLDIVERYKSLDDATILDFGCGAKIAQALHQIGDPQFRYYGLDIYSELIEFLQQSFLDDPAYAFSVVPFHNAMYNPTGEMMTPDSALPIPDIRADIITMFSVVTHLNPEDCVAVLSILKRYAKPETRLIFSTFLQPDQVEPFVDQDPMRPLLEAKYRPDFMRELITNAGWSIVEENPPFRKLIQHYFVCELS